MIVCTYTYDFIMAVCTLKHTGPNKGHFTHFSKQTTTRSVYFAPILTLSATPPGRMVLTTTPVLLPPMIPKPSPEPSLRRSITSI